MWTQIRFQVRIGTSIKPSGGIEGSTEYREAYFEKKGEKADFNPGNPLVSPYGDFQEGDIVRRLGKVKWKSNISNDMKNAQKDQASIINFIQNVS